MANLKEQLAAIKAVRQFASVSTYDLGLCGAERTLVALLAIKQHFIDYDPNNPVLSDQLAYELLRVLELHPVVKA